MTQFNILDISKKIGYKFNDWELLFTAFTHSSYAHEKRVKSYERLEFLGDSILNFVVAYTLFKRYPSENEGFLTKARANVVSQRTLSEVIDKMDIIKYIKVSEGGLSGEVKSSGNVRSDLFEAIAGAILIDGGMEEAEKFVLDKLQPWLNQNFTIENITDFKSRLLEAEKLDNLNIKITTLPKSEKLLDGFFTKVFLNGTEIGSGEGKSKKRAEQSAAKAALTYLVENGLIR